MHVNRGIWDIGLSRSEPRMRARVLNVPRTHPLIKHGLDTMLLSNWGSEVYEPTLSASFVISIILSN